VNVRLLVDVEGLLGDFEDMRGRFGEGVVPMFDNWVRWSRKDTIVGKEKEEVETNKYGLRKGGL
jgi:hypothetical protein